MPESRRRTPSSRPREPHSIRNDGIYISGKTKIVVKSSGYMGYDMLSAPCSFESEKFDTVFYFLRHPIQCLSELQKTIQKNGSLRIDTDEMNCANCNHLRKDSHGHANLEPSRSRRTTDGELASSHNDDSEASTRRGRRHRPSRRSNARSTRSHHDVDSARLPPNSCTIDVAALPRGSQSAGKERKEDQAAEYDRDNGVRKSGDFPTNATNPHAPVPGNPPTAVGKRGQLSEQEGPGLHYNEEHLTDEEPGPVRSHRRLPALGSDIDRNIRRAETAKDQTIPSTPPLPSDTRLGNSPTPKDKPILLQGSPIAREAARRNEDPQKKPEALPKLSKERQGEPKTNPIAPDASPSQKRAFDRSIRDLPQFQRQREKNFRDV